MGKKLEKKRGRGRPRKEQPFNTTLPVMVSEEIIERLDGWAKQIGVDSRSAAARALIEEGLDRAEKPAAGTKRKEK
jgi:metal-responsive CopG/Arc/MetJ family transcriptional regulator